MTTPRRLFLTVLGTSGVVGACSSQGSTVAPADVNAGNISDLPVDTLRPIGDLPIAIGRDAHGMYAVTLTCTHQGCNIAVNGEVSIYAIYCTCHGSLFSPDGAVLGGPATASLRNFAVELGANGALTIHAGEVVPAGTRTLTT